MAKVNITKRTVKKVNQFTLENLNHERACIEGKGWSDIKVEENFRDESFKRIVDLLGGRKDTKETILFKLRNQPLSHWGLQRFIYDVKYNRWSYCAGQDYTGEIAQIRNYIKNA